MFMFNYVHFFLVVRSLPIAFLNVKQGFLIDKKNKKL